MYLRAPVFRLVSFTRAILYSLYFGSYTIACSSQVLLCFLCEMRIELYTHVHIGVDFERLL